MSFSLNDDEARTGSNLSDRSAFSFAAGSYSGSVRSRLGLGAAAALAKDEGAASGAARLGSSGGTSEGSGNSYNTGPFQLPGSAGRGDPACSSGTATVRALPRRLAAIITATTDDTPGSPSKSKPRRASWLGSFRRVFGGGTNSSTASTSSRGDSPAHETEDEFLEPRLFGLQDLPHASLLRRKQGPSAWEAHHQQQQQKQAEGEPAARPPPPARCRRPVMTTGMWRGAGEGRMVQVMFTVPRDKLRVVNAEVEREEGEVEIVDPEREEGVPEIVDPDRDEGSHADRTEQTTTRAATPVGRNRISPRRAQPQQRRARPCSTPSNWEMRPSVCRPRRG